MQNLIFITTAVLLLITTFFLIRSYYRNNLLSTVESVSIIDIHNEQIRDYAFLADMRSDSYFPSFLVDKCESILIELCINIEQRQPQNLKELYKLTHTATRKMNALESEFFENDSEIETAARESIGKEFEFIAKAYTFNNANIERLIAPRNW
ncbi:DUF5713 family protein [Carboxylicivirga marina]|uniref:LemA family protein n=1 Tax=Carboxylicivirga marina TaxID=2800988 RepID=A0ABS1HE64_9BACT|nr:DUF5713 family protein [Carboxylicivirga marina]MBK3515963.1 hypothetical protein [Carboxylicivirga marina]